MKLREAACSIRLIVAAGIMSVAFVSSAWAQNYNQIAILKWYRANLTTTYQLDGPTDNLNNIVFDGSSIWVYGTGKQYLIKVDALTGEILGRFPLTATGGPMAFDGTNIWVLLGSSSRVEKLRASDGTSQAVYSLGFFPSSIAFDGSNMWVTGNDSVVKLRALDGQILGAYPTGKTAAGVAFDGFYVWVCNRDDYTVVKLTTDGNIVFTYSNIYGAKNPAFDGTSMWVTGSPDLYKLAPDGSTTEYRPYGDPGASLGNIAFDGQNMWISVSAAVGREVVAAVRVSDGKTVGTFPMAVPKGVAFDGTSVWVAAYGKLHKL